MKKIMFNDKYRLTQAVLEGRKTMTRKVFDMESIIGKEPYHQCYEQEIIKTGSRYQVGEVVAIAQAYQDCGYELMGVKIQEKDVHKTNKAGWSNKMFVKADLMPHHIRITNIRVERLQDISDEDCLREGIIDNNDIVQYEILNHCYFSPREAFAYLIDKVSGKGTWERNPYIFVYEFKLID